MIVVEADDPWAEFDTEPAELPRLEPEARVKRSLPLRKWSLRGLAAVLALVVTYFVHSRVVTSVVYEQRQEHLAADLNRPKSSIHEGEALGYIQVPSIGLNDVMVEGVTVDALRSGPAHVSHSALPGDAGPMVVYGHRSAYGGPFRRISELAKDDQIVVQARSGGPIVQYVVASVERATTVGDVKLDKTDELAYLLLVTAEPGVFDDAVTVVVARALPVTDAAPVSVDLSDDPDRGFPFGIALLLGNVSAIGAILSFRFLSRRASPVILFLVVSPQALLAGILVLNAFETIRPLAR
jgi:LPXTG-site transpeptidase (sortase) family protein